MCEAWCTRALELADRVQNAADAPGALASLAAGRSLVEAPANTVRSVTRLFTSDVEDKPWYQRSRDVAALSHHARGAALQPLSISPSASATTSCTKVTDAYFLFAYPFLLSVPGYNVRAPQLPDAERDSNLEMLQFISEQTVARGLHFQLGLWMHGYEWIDSPKPNYTIEGLTAETHGPYCRDAVRALLQGLPGDQRRHVPHSRRERSRRRQLRFLEDGVRRRRHVAAAPSRSTCTPKAWIRRCSTSAWPPGAAEDLAQILGRTPGHAVSSGRHPRAGAAQAGRADDSADEVQRRAPAVSCATDMATCCGKTGSGA